MIASTTPPDLGMWAMLIAILGGAIRVGTPYLFVSLGECLTEKSGRVNLGLEGNLVLGAMAAYGVSWATGSAWMGVVAAGIVGAMLGTLHALICNRPKVNSVAVGIAMMIFGVGVAYFLGKRFISPVAPKLSAIEFGWWSDIEQLRYALAINPLFLIGVAVAPVMAWMLTYTRWGLIVRLAGENQDAAAAMGYSVPMIRICATALGGVLAGIGGSYLSLYYPGSWNEQLSTGQGLMAVALVIFARWKPLNCLWASLLFGGVGSFGSVLQGQQQNLTELFGQMGGFGSALTSMNLFSPAAGQVWNAMPYILTLVIMIITCSRARAMIGAPGELSVVR